MIECAAACANALLRDFAVRFVLAYGLFTSYDVSYFVPKQLLTYIFTKQ